MTFVLVRWGLMDMIRLVYKSLACKLFTQNSIDVLLEQSRGRNGVMGLTGMLLYDRGVFLQVLEGREVDVEPVFSSVLRDPRHTAVKVLGREPIQHRHFAAWTMAFSNISFSAKQPLAQATSVLRWPDQASADVYFYYFRPGSEAYLDNLKSVQRGGY